MISNRYDVAISVAKADLEVAEEMAERLNNRGLKVYYYKETPEETLGEDLEQALRRIYSSATIALILVSSRYSTSATKIELEACLNGEASESGIIPVLLDSSPLPRSLEGRTYLTLEEGTNALIHTILKKLRRRPISTPILALSAFAFSLMALMAMVWD